MTNSGGTYSKFANFGVIDTKDFIFFRDTQAKAGDHVNDKEDDAAAEEGVGHAGDGIGKLVAELDVIVVDPAAVDLGRAVQVGNVVTT